MRKHAEFEFQDIERYDIAPMPENTYQEVERT